jgi:hypothetical protein
VEIMEGVLALQPLQTNCLAQDRCGVPILEETSSSMSPVVGRCKPGSGCC